MFVKIGNSRENQVKSVMQILLMQKSVFRNIDDLSVFWYTFKLVQEGFKKFS